VIPTSTPPACSAPYELSLARSATGGNAWNRVAEISADGQTVVAGLRGTVRLQTDLVEGRYAQHFDVPGMGSSAEVYDGRTIWARDISGGVHPYDAPFARKRAITSAYLDRRAYFDSAAAATIACAGKRVEAGRTSIVIRVQPRGGVPADLAIDTRTHLVKNVSIQLPLPSDDGTTWYGDFRRVDGMMLPYSISSGTSAKPADGYKLRVREYAISRHVRADDFSKPVASLNARMIGTATSTTVPMTLEGRQLIVWASINGHNPMPFILDTGGHAIFTSQAVRLLGLRSRGSGLSGGSGPGTISTQYTHVRSVRIGTAELLDQPFLVIPYPYSFYERGKKQPLAGILGLEFFERFAIRLDYGNRQVTLGLFRAIQAPKNATQTPLMFEDQEDLPVVEGAADGHLGLFGTDTGNAGTVILFGGFLRRTGLLAAYRDGLATISSGTGGQNAGRDQTIRSFTFAGRITRDVDANFTDMTSGSFASRTEAGNIGFSILSRYIPTFDYDTGVLYLQSATRETTYGVNRAGIHVEKNVPEAFYVDLVDPGSAGASAGLATGDRIVAIDGIAASNFSWADLSALTSRRRGTKLELTVERANSRRRIDLTLR
jgi:hypothetical protein